MSLLMIDLAYLGTKTIIQVGYYIVKGTYNTVAYFTGSDLIVEPIDDKATDNRALLDEIKTLRNEMDHLRKEIKTINDDTYMLLDNENGETRVVANIIDGDSIIDKNNEIEL